MISKLNFQDGNLNFNKKNIKMNFWFKKKNNFVKKEKKMKNSLKNKAAKEQLPHYELSMANIIK